MQARYYDPYAGRFLAVDPVQANTGSFNRYWYANNNPYVYTDPDGREGCAASRIGAVCAQYGWSNTISTAAQGGIKQASKAAVDTITAPWGGWDSFEDDLECTWKCGLPGDGSLEGQIGALPIIPVIARGATSGLSMTRTVAGHLKDIVAKGPFKGEVARPYLKYPQLLVREIMATGKGAPDPRGVAGALRWDVPGTFRGTQGTWELVVKDDLILHFNFVGL